MTITISRLDEPTVFDSVRCYKPIKGGTRHLAAYRGKPRNGTIIQLWCEKTFVVGIQRRSLRIHDCSGCLATYLAAQPTGEHQ